MSEEVGIAVRPVKCVWNWTSPTTELTLWGWIADWDHCELNPDPREVAKVLWLSAEDVAAHVDGMATNPSFAAALIAEDRGAGR